MLKGKHKSIKDFLHEKFNLDEDKASQDEVISSIKKGVEFKGTNLWVLIFATFVASLGLNTNSTAVIIGAMLISPLMGPIMGIGLALGINDFELIKRSVRNFGFMIAVGILTSTVYFFISPITDAQSELLARTAPTIYDVLIAFFGGLAGIVAQSRQDRTSSVIPGVAIATALMPPLCTAGYGLATGQMTYFIGAFYLFIINTVFIAFATYLIVRFLRYDKKVFLDKRREKTVTRYMAIILFAIIVPSAVIGYRLIQESVFNGNVTRFVNNVVKFENSQVIQVNKKYDRRGSTVELVMIGDPVSSDAIANITAQLPTYFLLNTTLSVRQPSSIERVGFSALESNISQLLDEKNNRIRLLESRLSTFTSETVPSRDIAREIAALSDVIETVSISRNITYSTQGSPVDTMLLCFVTLKDGDIDQMRKDMIFNWLKARTGSEKVKMILE